MPRLIRQLSFAVFAVALLSLVSPGLHAAARGKTYVFNGKIQEVNAGAGTFTLSGDGKLYAFRVTNGTNVTWNGKPLKTSDLKPGQEAEVEMKLAADGKGDATSVKVDSPWTPRPGLSRQGLSGPQANSIWAATTPAGKRLTADEIRPLILSSQWPTAVHRVIGYRRLKPGVFLLSVRSDGTVANVETLQAVGHPGADADVIKALRTWRFRPNSLKEVRVPAQYGFQ
jgi:TonB family protein